MAVGPSVISGLDEIVKNGDPQRRAEATQKISELCWPAPRSFGARCAVGLEWASARALILLRLGPGRVPSATDMEQARLNFERLADPTVQRVVNFWRTRPTA